MLVDLAKLVNLQGLVKFKQRQDAYNANKFGFNTRSTA